MSHMIRLVEEKNFRYKNRKGNFRRWEFQVFETGRMSLTFEDMFKAHFYTGFSKALSLFAPRSRKLDLKIRLSGARPHKSWALESCDSSSERKVFLTIEITANANLCKDTSVIEKQVQESFEWAVSTYEKHFSKDSGPCTSPVFLGSSTYEGMGELTMQILYRLPPVCPGDGRDETKRQILQEIKNLKKSIPYTHCNIEVSSLGVSSIHLGFETRKDFVQGWEGLQGFIPDLDLEKIQKHADKVVAHREARKQDMLKQRARDEKVYEARKLINYDARLAALKKELAQKVKELSQ